RARCRAAGSLVQLTLELLAGGEDERLCLGDGDGLAVLRVAAHARRPLALGEGPESWIRELGLDRPRQLGPHEIIAELTEDRLPDHESRLLVEIGRRPLRLKALLEEPLLGHPPAPAERGPQASAAAFELSRLSRARGPASEASRGERGSIHECNRANGFDLR